MKKQIVIKVQMHCSKSRRKAMKLVASEDGVDSIKLDGQDKNQLVVVGEADPVKLTGILRKKIGYSELVKVEEMKKDGEEKKPEEKPKYPWYDYPPTLPVLAYDVRYYSNPSRCSIM